MDTIKKSTKKRKRSQKDPNCNQHNLMMPIELEYRYARSMGIPTGFKPNKAQAKEINSQMIRDLEDCVRHVVLTAEDYMQIAKEIEDNERALGD